jgi:hypothetical protein
MKTFTVALLLLTASALCFGQTPKAALSTSNSDVYVGYITTFPDYGPKFDTNRFDGAEVAFTEGITPRWAVIASGAFSFGGTYSAKQFSGTVGPKFNFLTGPIRPYATVQVGYARQSSNGMYAGDHHPPLTSKNDVESGITYRAGLGLDVHLTGRIYWRALQWDTQPQDWGRHTPFYTNYSSGLGYRF